MEYEDNTLGIRIREARTKAGLTQETLGKQLNKIDSTVRMWECGKSQPDSRTLAKISKILNVSADYLLGNINYDNGTTKNESEILILQRNAKKMTNKERAKMNEILKTSFDRFDWGN